ncbi:MAG: class I SAM-dependent methyltransferase [Acidobacteriota bacterium]
MTRALAFLSSPPHDEYGSRFSRLRWRRAVAPDRVAVWDTLSPARASLGGADSWVVVLEESALPAPGGVPEPPAGSARFAEAAIPSDPPFVHTLRELEAAQLRGTPEGGPGGPGRTVALAFRSGQLTPAQGETVGAFLGRLSTLASTRPDPAFRVIRFDDPSGRERPELTRRLPRGPARILDVGCGAGGGIASASASNPGWHVTGIERDPDLALRARDRCHRVVEGDLLEVLPRLAAAGEEFDVIVFADVLEHVEDPVAALRAGRRLAAADAILVASVPNAGHLSIVRDLIQGRFDPIPAGLCDSGHVRWFTRSWLSEALEEAGWRVRAIEGERGAPAPDAAAFLDLAASWPGSDLESLRTYQWVAVCGAA